MNEFTRLLRAKGWTQEAVSRRWSVSQPTISRWSRNPSKQDETIQSQADKITELVKHVESGDECHKGVTARKCHCEPIQEKYDKLKELNEAHRKYAKFLGNYTDSLSSFLHIHHMQPSDELLKEGEQLRAEIKALVELAPEEMDGNQTP